jgi:hypothetical protein
MKEASVFNCAGLIFARRVRQEAQSFLASFTNNCFNIRLIQARTLFYGCATACSVSENATMTV